MSRSLRKSRRLPGFSFEVQSPPLPEVLPRMDVAAFVGFAASGPLETPVAVETMAQFSAIFGSDAPLAWDKKRGEQLNAYLAPAVRAFFLNGGQRCWIVRVARRKAFSDDLLNQARYNYLPIPGLALARFDAQGKVLSLMPALARARSEGSWSDGLRVSTALLTRPVQVVQIVQETETEIVIDLSTSAPDDISVGELLRLSFTEDGYVLLLVVKAIDKGTVSSPLNADPSLAGRLVRVKASKAVWFKTVTPESLPPPDTQVEVSLYTYEANHPPEPDTEAEQRPDFESVDEAVINPTTGATQPDSEQTITLDLLHTSLADAPAPGSVVRVGTGTGQIWLTVEQVGIGGAGTSSGELVRIMGEGLWWVETPPISLPASIPAAERLSFEMKVSQDDDYSVSLSDLAFDESHERFWGLLPTDEKLYADAEAGLEETPAIVWWRPVGDIFRFPLAGSGVAGELYFPLFMSPLHTQSLGPVKLQGSELERNGLAEFEASLFIDEELLDTQTEDLLSNADFIRYLSPTPRALNGIQAVLCKEEVTIVAVPDAVHRGWAEGETEDPPPADASLPLPRPDWWRFLPCAPAPSAVPVTQSQWPIYCGSSESTTPAPEFESGEEAEEADALTLSWSSESEAEGISYILEEATSPDFINAARIYSGPDNHISISGRNRNIYYYRVRAEIGGVLSDWSEGFASRGNIPLVSQPLWGNFLSCSLRVLDPPQLETSDQQTTTGTFTLAWSSLYAGEDVEFVLEESGSTDFSGAVTIYNGPQTRFTIYGRSPGDYYYRVRLSLDGNISDWSNGVVVRVALSHRWQLNPEEDYAPDTLLAVQRSLLRMCAARGDLFAVLSLPEHYREDRAIEHVTTLKLTPELVLPTAGVSALGYGEARNFSFGAIYHPWLVGREEVDSSFASFRRTPPCGAACGVMARRALRRGAWIAPANETMQSVIALEPPIQRERRLSLQEAQINLIRQETHGFLTLSADTLSDEEDFRPINVRRLLMLLRRQALRLGSTYVFEPQSNAFQRLVERGFTAMMDALFTRGAFAGSTAANAYRVVTNETVNTPQSMEQGRFIVELRVAPSRPLTFLTIRLVQTGDRGVVTEGR